tara:strand:+ start:20830 stop:21120 length:291 start_codon:yes stop_codon:yes gene_type:complete
MISVANGRGRDASVPVNCGSIFVGLKENDTVGFPNDYLRFITGVEALNGLLLIASGPAPSSTSPWDASGPGRPVPNPLASRRRRVSEGQRYETQTR